jgi:hypothetical protein
MRDLGLHWEIWVLRIVGQPGMVQPMLNSNILDIASSHEVLQSTLGTTFNFIDSRIDKAIEPHHRAVSQKADKATQDLQVVLHGFVEFVK